MSKICGAVGGCPFAPEQTSGGCPIAETCPGYRHDVRYKTADKSDGLPYQIVTVNSISIYDEEEIHPNCTVQILRNSVTGEESVGWWENT